MGKWAVPEGGAILEGTPKITPEVILAATIENTPGGILRKIIQAILQVEIIRAIMINFIDQIMSKELNVINMGKLPETPRQKRNL